MIGGTPISVLFTRTMANGTVVTTRQLQQHLPTEHSRRMICLGHPDLRPESDRTCLP